MYIGTIYEISSIDCRAMYSLNMYKTQAKDMHSLMSCILEQSMRYQVLIVGQCTLRICIKHKLRLFKILHEILQFTNKFLWFIICLVFLCYVMTKAKEIQDGRNGSGRSGSLPCPS